jgi:signal peptidase II
VSSAPVTSKLDKADFAVEYARNRYVFFFALATFGCVTDLITKYLVFRWRGFPQPHGPGGVWWIWEGYLGFETSLNSGALFGYGSGYGLLFAALSVVAAIGIYYWLFCAGAARDLLLTLALGSISGGVFGNLFDRLGLYSHPDGQWHGEVRDWILFRYGQYTWPNFNIADSMLVCGAAILVWHAFFAGEAKTKQGE